MPGAYDPTTPFACRSDKRPSQAAWCRSPTPTRVLPWILRFPGQRLLSGGRSGWRARVSGSVSAAQPTLADSEVLTIECVGEFLGIDTDSGLYQYFGRHWAD
jgi:hypothetical protein